MDDPLSRLNELHRRYDVVPDHLRAAAELGSIEALELMQAEGQAAFFRAMVRGQIGIIRARRRALSFAPYLLNDLDTYRRGWRRWHRRRLALRRAAKAPLAQAAE